MTPPTLTEIRQRTERNASLRSDDFGHDCQALLVAESEALQVAANDIEHLLALVEWQQRALTYAQQWTPSIGVLPLGGIENMRAEVARILAGGANE